MNKFPYREVFKRAGNTTIKNPWLAIFGIFLGGFSGLDFLDFVSFRRQEPIQEINNFWQYVQTSVSEHPWETAGLTVLVLTVSLGLLVLIGWSRASAIWAANEIARNENQAPVHFKAALAAGRKYLWRVIGLKVGSAAAFFVLVSIFAIPIVYLFSAGAVSRAVFLTFFGVLFFLPALAVLGFANLYGPIFIVLHDVRIWDSVALSFQLLKNKLRETVILALLMLGAGLLFIFFLGFSILLLNVPFLAVIAMFGALDLSEAAFAVAVSAIVVSAVFIILLSSLFAAFQAVVWVLALLEMVKTEKLPEEAEPVPAAEIV